MTNISDEGVVHLMAKLVQLQEEADRLLTTYVEHKDCNDPHIRRKVHVSLDRFLMEHRETAAVLLIKGLSEEIEQLRAELKLDFEKKPSLLQRLLNRLRKDSNEQEEIQEARSAHNT